MLLRPDLPSLCLTERWTQESGGGGGGWGCQMCAGVRGSEGYKRDEKTQIEKPTGWRNISRRLPTTRLFSQVVARGAG